MSKAKTHIKKSDNTRTLCNRYISKSKIAVNDEVATCKICVRLKKEIKVGRPKKLTPSELYTHFDAYRKYCKDNPYKRIDFKGKDADEVVYTHEKPLLWDGFAIYLFRNNILANLDDYKSNRNGAYQEFSSTLDMIRREIREDHIGGSGAGIYNASIMAKVAGLVDKSEVKTEVTQKITKIGFDENEKEEV